MVNFAIGSSSIWLTTPMGVRLVELEEEFGLARIRIVRVLRELMDDIKVEKRDLLYFAI